MVCLYFFSLSLSLLSVLSVSPSLPLPDQLSAGWFLLVSRFLLKPIHKRMAQHRCATSFGQNSAVHLPLRPCIDYWVLHNITVKNKCLDFYQAGFTARLPPGPYPQRGWMENGFKTPVAQLKDPVVHELHFHSAGLSVDRRDACSVQTWRGRSWWRWRRQR